MTTSKTRVFVCMWDCNGFEVLKDCSSWERESLLNTIAGKELSKPPVNLTSMTMRARFNPQRHYEIYTFNTVEELDEETLWRWADENPQMLADLIRDRGKKLYGEPATTEPRIR